MRIFYLCFEFFFLFMKVSINKCEIIFQKIGKICLMVVVVSGSVKVVRVILERGVDVNVLDIKYNYVVYYVVIGGSLVVLVCMFGYGVLFDQINLEGNIFIYNVVMNGYGMCCKFLV